MNTILLIIIVTAIVLLAVIAVLVKKLNAEESKAANIPDNSTTEKTVNPEKTSEMLPNYLDDDSSLDNEQQERYNTMEVGVVDFKPESVSGYVDIEEWIAKETDSDEIDENPILDDELFGGEKTVVRRPTISLEERAGDIEELSVELIQALEQLSNEADNLRRKTMQLQRRTINLSIEKDQLAEEKDFLSGVNGQLTEEKNQLAEEKNRLAEEKNQLTQENNQLTEEKNQIAEEKDILTEEKNQLVEEKNQVVEENDSIKKEADALESLLQEKYYRIEELEHIIAKPEMHNPNMRSEDIRTTIKDILPDLQAMATEAMVDFSLKIDDMDTTFVLCDKDLINNMIIKMVFSGLRYSETGGKLIFSIDQVDSNSDEFAEYVYTCIYLGDQLDFYSEEATEMGGIVDIQRTPDGGVAISVRLKFRIDRPELPEFA